MTTHRIRSIFCKKSEYADLEYLPEQIYEAIIRYVENSNLDIEDITEGEFEVRIDWRRK